MAQTLMTLVVRALDKDDIADTISKLNEARIRDIPTLKALSYSEWNELGLPLGVRKKLQLELGVAAAAPTPPPSHPAASSTSHAVPGIFSFASDPATAAAQQAAKSAALRLPLTRQRCRT